MRGFHNSSILSRVGLGGLLTGRHTDTNVDQDANTSKIIDDFKSSILCLNPRIWSQIRCALHKVTAQVYRCASVPIHIPEYWYTSVLVYQGVPVYRYTGLAVYWCNGAPVYPCTRICVYLCTGVLVYRLAGILMPWCTFARRSSSNTIGRYRSAGVPVHRCTGVPLRRCIGVTVYQRIGVPVYH